MLYMSNMSQFWQNLLGPPSVPYPFDEISVGEISVRRRPDHLRHPGYDPWRALGQFHTCWLLCMVIIVSVYGKNAAGMILRLRRHHQGKKNTNHIRVHYLNSLFPFPVDFPNTRLDAFSIDLINSLNIWCNDLIYKHIVTTFIKSNLHSTTVKRIKTPRLGT